MKRLIYLSVYLVSISPLFSQQACDCSKRLSKLAWHFYVQQQYEESLSAILKAISFADKNATRTNYVVLAYLYEKTNQPKMAADAMLKAVEKGLTIEEITSESYIELKDKLRAKYWKRILKQYDQHHLKYKSGLNLEYRLAIEWLKGSDQRIRKAEKMLPPEDVALLDSLNFRDLKRLFDNYGFPTISKHGFNWQSVDAFFMHYSLKSPDAYNDVIQIMEKTCSEGFMDCSFTPVIIDRYRRRVNKSPQLYGEWNLAHESGKYGEIEDLQHLDERRFKFNLLRLQEQSLTESRELPAGYLPAVYPSNYFCGFQFK